MAMIVGIKFRNSNKVYYFDPVGNEFCEGDGVIVETARGQEYGTVSIPNREVDEKEVVSPLKPVVRKATDEDEKRLQKNLADREPALRTIREKAAELGLNMKLVDAEYTFDRSKLIFYFTADGRVDFRELVRALASIFKVRIELRQIYERDDTKMRGALAACGRPCCCTTHLPDFEKVSIKMAKVQGLSLNPQKISGVCGRLLCCLKYENEYYSEVYKKMPKIGSKVHTADGDGVVESNDMIKQTSRVRVLTKDGSYDVKTYKLEELKTTARQRGGRRPQGVTPRVKRHLRSAPRSVFLAPCAAFRERKFGFAIANFCLYARRFPRNRLNCSAACAIMIAVERPICIKEWIPWQELSAMNAFLAERARTPAPCRLSPKATASMSSMRMSASTAARAKTAAPSARSPRRN